MELAAGLALTCLSDLRFLNDYSKLHRLVSKIPLARYSFKEWNDAANYLSPNAAASQKAKFPTAEDARNFLLNTQKRTPGTV